MLETSEASVKGALQRARATLDARLPAGGRERVPLPDSVRERELVGRFAAAVEQGDTAGMISLLTDDAWLTMPPQPYEYQGGEAIARVHRPRAGGPSRRQPPARADPRQRPARVRLLPPGSPRADRPRLRDDGAHAERGPRVCDHLVRRAQPVRRVRTAEDVAGERVESLTSGPGYQRALDRPAGAKLRRRPLPGRPRGQ